MISRIEITASAKKELGSLPPTTHRRIVEAIRGLSSDPRPHPQCKKLKSPLHGYRIRVGLWRVLYEVNDAESLVTVYAVRPRREAYR